MEDIFFVVEFLTSNMLSKELFVYNVAEELPHEGEYVYYNEVAGEILTLQKNKLEYHKTRPLRQDELT